ncbi:MAG: hypothetical protein ACI8QZ_001775 [Chlamydiales bacterium]|jgi:hypothetical protein
MADTDDMDYGPLAGLIGTWEGDKGMDVAPEPDGTEESPYFETIVFDGAGQVENAESQCLAVVRYHQVVRRKSDGEIFHDQVGYWTWDAKTSVLAQSLTIPRAVCVLAGGECTAVATSGEKVTLKVTASDGDADWGIVQSPFMRDNARTVAFEHTIEIDGNWMEYSETTQLQIYGRAFEHTDTNQLARS